MTRASPECRWLSKLPRPPSPRPTARPSRCCAGSALARVRDAVPGTAPAHGTLGAFRRQGLADVLAEGDQQIVVADPVAAGQAPPERHLRLLRIAGLHIAPTVRDAVHVHVDADPRLVEALGHHEIGRLASHALERQQGVDLIGPLPAEAVEEIPADARDDARL